MDCVSQEHQEPAANQWLWPWQSVTSLNKVLAVLLSFGSCLLSGAVVPRNTSIMGCNNTKSTETNDLNNKPVDKENPEENQDSQGTGCYKLFVVEILFIYCLL